MSGRTRRGGFSAFLRSRYKCTASCAMSSDVYPFLYRNSHVFRQRSCFYKSLSPSIHNLVRQTFVYIISSHYIKCELFSFLVLQILSLCLLVRLFSICFSILFFIPNLTNNASFNLFLTTRLKDTQVSLTRLRPVASKSVKALIVLV